MKKDFQVFVADVDNTLKGRINRIPGKQTIEAFEEMHRRGMKVGVASGRPLWQNLKDHHKEWKLSFQFDFLIGMNGGEIWDKESNTVTTYHQLSKEQLKLIVTSLHDLEGINPFVYRDGMELSRYIDDEMIASSERHGTRLEAVSDESELWAEPTGKILVRCGNAENGERVEKYAREVLPDDIAVFRTTPFLVEMQDPRVTKGSGIEEWCNAHSISLNDVIAFGDADNDVDMLKRAGYSVALANAFDTVKEVTDDVTESDCDHDGVGEYLFKNVL